MKMNKKMREAALTTMITLALSGSALAMPSGGSVVQGNVTINGAAATGIDSVANNATIAANSNSIIDWKAFGIEAGQTLNFDTSKGALLNRVIGSNISEILGTLTQKGDNPLLLVNPNGILVGGNATINASQLVLSTLAMSNDDFNKFANQGAATFATDSNYSGPASIMVEKGANINIDEILLMAGGTVNVADGVKFTTDNSRDAMIEIAAANKVTVNRDVDGVQDSMESIVTTKDNAISFHGEFDNTKATGNTNFHLDGGTVNMDNAKLKLNNKSEAYLAAGNKDTNSFTTDNVISGKNTTIEGGKTVLIAGGKVSLEDSSINSDAAKTNVSVLAGDKIVKVDESKGDTFRTATASAGNEVVLKNTSITNKDGEIQVNAGKATLDNAKLSSDDTVQVSAYKDGEAFEKHEIGKALGEGNTVTLKNGSSINATNCITVAGHDVEKSATVTIGDSKEGTTIADHTFSGSNITPKIVADTETTGFATAAEAVQLKPTSKTQPVPEPTPEPEPQPEPQPEPAPEPTPAPEPQPVPQPSFGADDKQNIANGEKAMGDIISGNSSLADKQSATDKFVHELNNGNADERAKAGEVLGMLNQIKTDSSMTLAEKQVLQLTVLNAYEPTKNAKAQDEQSKTAEGRAAANQVVDTQAVQAATGANESANDVAVDASAVAE